MSPEAHSASKKYNTEAYGSPKPAGDPFLLAVLQQRKVGTSHGIMIQPWLRAYRELLLTARLTLSTN